MPLSYQGQRERLCFRYFRGRRDRIIAKDNEKSGSGHSYDDQICSHENKIDLDRQIATSAAGICS